MFKQITIVAACALSASAHMQLYYPPPFRAYNNPHTVGAPDDELLFPYNCCGKITPMPCRGYLSLLGTPEGASVANWAAGSQQKWSMAGPAPLGGNHYGGSCQIGFSIDKGNTFHTAVSYEGNCPLRHGGEQPAGQEFPFTVPADLPNGDVVFAWTWVNREQEFFMNCAVVTISGGSGTAAAAGSSGTSPATPLKSSKPVAVAAAVAAPSSTPTSSDGTLDIPYSKEAGVVEPAAAQPQTQVAAQASADDEPPAGQPSVVTISAAGTSADASPAAATSGSGSGSASGGQSNHKGFNRSKGKCSHQNDNQKRSHPLLDTTMKYKRALGQKSQRFVQRAASTPFSSRPLMLFANVNNGCTTPKTTAELKYPSPGPDVVEGDGEYPLQLPSGTCQ